MTMTNAEWMIKNGYDFYGLYIAQKSEGTYTIWHYGDKLETIDLNDSKSQALLAWLDMKHKEQILDEVEKKYLSAVIKPFRDDVRDIRKMQSIYRLPDDGKEYIKIRMRSDEEINLPYFRKGTMYKGMELGRRYTLEELGLCD